MRVNVTLTRRRSSSGLAWPALVYLALGLVGCATLDARRVRKHIDRSDFSSALALLEEKGVAAHVEPGSDPKLVEARFDYQRAVERKYESRISTAENHGEARRALRLSEDGLRRCSWSPRLQDRRDGCARRVKGIESLLTLWESTAEDLSADADQAAKFISQAEVYKDLLKDSPDVEALLHRSEITLVDALGRQIRNCTFGEPSRDTQRAYSAVRDFVTVGQMPAPFDGIVTVPATLPESPSPATVDVKRLTNCLRRYEDARKYEEANNGYAARVIAGSVIDKVDQWTLTVMSPLLRSGDACYGYLELAEEIIGVVKDEVRKQLVAALCEGYLERAEMWAGSGIESALSLLYLARIEDLGVSPGDRAEGVREKASAALVGATPIDIGLTLDADPAIEPALLPVLLWWIYTDLIERTGNYHAWRFGVNAPSVTSLSMTIADADCIYDGIDVLRTIESQYLSHYQDVPNPRKDQLKVLLMTAEFQVNSAEYSLSSAINTHNIYPTAYSLGAVNSARNYYANQVNQYNMYVNTYNATPTTISQAVYLPYYFQEGLLNLGWALKVECALEDQNFKCTGRSTESDKVRVGTKYNDTSVSRRRDDPLDIDMSFERSLHHLSEAMAEVFECIGQELTRIEYSRNDNLSDAEKQLLSGLLHPWGIHEGRFSQGEESRALRRIATQSLLPVVDTAPPAIALREAPREGQELTAEEMAEAYSRFVCQVASSVDGVSFGSGTGVLVSPDGLILTCAHVVMGRSVEVVFHEGALAGSHQAVPVFVNSKRDVAVLQIEGIRSSGWVNVRLHGEVQRGEEIIAIGNPALPSGELNILGVSKGVVSNPEAELMGGAKLVADISIASGSSGGPLFSTRNGDVVGIVLAVAEARMEVEGAASGYTCLAAPSLRLGEWLGLEIQGQNPTP